jgi:hypothetical protein
MMLLQWAGLFIQPATTLSAVKSSPAAMFSPTASQR